MNSLDFPKYDGKESITKYILRVEKFKSIILKEKYDIVINFINEWMNKNFKSLTDFKNINEDFLLNNKKHNRIIVRKYSEIFEKKFNIDLTIDEETESDDIADKYILIVLTKVLNYLDYQLSKILLNNKTYYSIKKK